MMPSPSAILVKGAPGSPYTRKMLAVLRYRHIPYEFVVGSHGAARGLPAPKVELLPTFYFPDGKGAYEAAVDSTPLIRRLEAQHQGRSILPADPAAAFLDALMEDYADEWLTKAMFHYRWRYPADIDKAGDILPRWRGVTAPEAEAQAMKRIFSERQIGRLRYVGSNDETAGAIEQGYQRFLALFEAHLSVEPFFFGARPAASDFAAYGQLTQLTHFDPTPMALCLSQAPRVYAWVDLLDDLSGLACHDDGFRASPHWPETLRAIFVEIGRVYAPLLIANAAAHERGEAEFETVIEGAPWRQQTFPYHVKCLAELRKAFQALPQNARTQVTAFLQGTGCEPICA